MPILGCRNNFEHGSQSAEDIRFLSEKNISNQFRSDLWASFKITNAQLYPNLIQRRVGKKASKPYISRKNKTTSATQTTSPKCCQGSVMRIYRVESSNAKLIKQNASDNKFHPKELKPKKSDVRSGLTEKEKWKKELFTFTKW